MPPYRVTVLWAACHAGEQGIGGSWPWGFVTQVPAELSEGQLTMAPFCKDSISPGPGRGQEDGQGDLCRSQGPLWVQAWSPWRHQGWLLSVLSLPSPTLQVLGPRSQRREGSRLAESSTELVGLGTVLSNSAVCAAFGKVVLIPFHLLSMAVSCLQAQGGQFLKSELLCGPSPPHVLIHPSGCPGPLCWLASPSASGISPLSAAPPSLLFWATAGQAWDASAKSPGREGRRGGKGRGAGARDEEGIN